MIRAHIVVVPHELRERNRVVTHRLEGAAHLPLALAGRSTQAVRQLHGCARVTVEKTGPLDDEEPLDFVEQGVD